LVRRAETGDAETEELDEEGHVMSRDFVGALLQLNAEKGVPRETLIETVEEAIRSAYRDIAAGNENINVRIDAETGKIHITREKEVVDSVEDESLQMTVAEARRFRPSAAVGEFIEVEQVPSDYFGRIAAQRAKQVVLQRLREAEREELFRQYAGLEADLITGHVSRVEPRAIILELARPGTGTQIEAILPTTEQSATEHYRIGQPLKAFVLEVRRSTRGPQILVSRSHKNFLRRLFELEVPEIHSGLVEIKAIAREAGSRSKVAVASRQAGLDPVGATVGQRGARVQAVVAELGGEKVDIVPWSEDASQFVASALSPAQVVRVDIDEGTRIATVIVPERMLSLAIGREGQNARLAAKLTGWRIDIRSEQAYAAEKAAKAAVGEEPTVEALLPATAEAAEKPKRATRAKAPAKEATPAAVTPAATATVAKKATAATAKPAAKAKVTSKAATKPAAKTAAKTKPAAAAKVKATSKAAAAKPAAKAKPTTAKATGKAAPATAAKPAAKTTAKAKATTAKPQATTKAEPVVKPRVARSTKAGAAAGQALPRATP
jgi:transcription termination/antitermination protein NusA